MSRLLQHADDRRGARLRDQPVQLIFAFRVVAPATADVDDMRPVCSQELIGKQVKRLPPLRDLLVKRGNQRTYMAVTERDNSRQARKSLLTRRFFCQPHWSEPVRLHKDKVPRS